MEKLLKLCAVGILLLLVLSVEVSLSQSAHVHTSLVTTNYMFNTQSATQNYETYCVSACAGDRILLSSCESFSGSGDSYFRLDGYNSDGTTSQLISDDDGCSSLLPGTGSLLSYIDYTTPVASTCHEYCLRMGCYGSSSCRYTTNITVISTVTLTAPQFPYRTGPLVSTSSATVNFEQACVRACYGETLTFDSCSNPSSDTYMRLYDAISGGQQVGSDDDGCPGGSHLSLLRYTVTTPGCQDYCLHMGCYSNVACGPFTVNFQTTSAIPTIATNTPTVVVTAAPTLPPAFPVTVGSLTGTNSAQVGYQQACTTACVGEKLIFSSCDSGTQTDSYFRLYDVTNNVQLASDDDGCPGGGRLSMITYTVETPGCHDYCLHMGCYGSSSCGGYTVTLATDNPTAPPVPSPYTPSAPPSVRPTVQPSVQPTAQANGFPHATSALSNTAYASVNYDTACVQACPGDVLTFSSCSDAYPHSGDSYFRLWDERAGLELAADDDGCPSSTQSLLTYIVPPADPPQGGGSQCHQYCLHMGCFSSGSCSYTATLTVQSPPTPAPTRYGASDFPLTTRAGMTNTNSAQQNYDVACASACYGDLLTFSSCNNPNTDAYLRLFDATSNIEVKRDDDGCRGGTQLSLLEYQVESHGCREFCLHMGCYGSYSCQPYSVEFTNSNYNYGPRDDPPPTSGQGSDGGNKGEVSTGVLVGAVVGAIAGTCLIFFCVMGIYFRCVGGKSVVIPQNSEVELVVARSPTPVPAPAVQPAPAVAVVVGSSAFGGTSAHNYTQPDFNMHSAGWGGGSSAPVAKAVTVQPNDNGNYVMAHVHHNSQQQQQQQQMDMQMQMQGPPPIYSAPLNQIGIGGPAPPLYYAPVAVHPQPQLQVQPQAQAQAQLQIATPNGQFMYTPAFSGAETETDL